MIDFAQERGSKLTIVSAGSLELEADVTFRCVREGETIEIPATDIVLAAGPWATRLTSKLLGKRAGAALDIEPRFVTPFPTPRSLLTTRVMTQIAGAQPRSFFDPQSPSPCMLSLPNSPCLQANRSLLNSTPAQMARYIYAEITRTPCVRVHFQYESWTSHPRRTQ